MKHGKGDEEYCIDEEAITEQKCWHCKQVKPMEQFGNRQFTTSACDQCVDEFIIKLEQLDNDES